MKKIAWASANMPVLNEIRRKFLKTKPLKNKKVSACLHITPETANLAITLKSAGANVFLCASNPLSTQNEIAYSLKNKFGILCPSKNSETNSIYYKNLKQALTTNPDLVIDDGADLISLLHSSYPKKTQKIKGCLEETTTGVIRLLSLEKSNKLLTPIFAINNARTKNLFDNRYGTGQSTIDGIIRATNTLLAGKYVVVAGYGWCGKGLAMRAKGLGAKVIVTEIDPIKALEAAMDGLEVMPMLRAAALGDIFCTVTGNINVITLQHFKKMKNGAIVCNSGHFDVEVDIKSLKKMARSIKKDIRHHTDEYLLPNNRKIFLLSEGRLVNLSAAEGHPASVMDMSFSTQALTAEYIFTSRQKFPPRIYYPPKRLEDKIAKLKLASMGIKIDSLTPEQIKYNLSWNQGT